MFKFLMITEICVAFVLQTNYIAPDSMCWDIDSDIYLERQLSMKQMNMEDIYEYAKKR